MVSPTAGILLAGGGGSRMGFDKALIAVGPTSLAERAAAVLLTVCDPCLEVGPGHSGLSAVRETPPGGGPLAALLAGAAALRAMAFDGPTIVLAVDMPRVDGQLLSRLIAAPPCDVLLPVVGGREQPLCARYSGFALALAADAWETGTRSMRGFIDGLPAGAHVVRPNIEGWGAAELAKFADLDTPADLGLLG